jgi:hypothetical protein
MATAISAFVAHLIFHPVISVRLDGKKGCYGPMTVYHFDDQKRLTGSHPAKYLRLHVENTGLSSIKSCSGYITKLTKRVGGLQTASEEEVVDRVWSNYDRTVRDIPRGAFFHMSITRLDLPPTGGSALGMDRLPSSLLPFFEGGKATYTFEILIASDNARPRRNIPVEFTFDPESNDLTFKPFNRARYPWWAWFRWLRHYLKERTSRRA